MNFYALDIAFMYLTNSAYLEDISTAIAEPLRHPERKNFLMKLDQIKIIAYKTKLIFNGAEAEYLSRYIYNYQQVLFKMYQYQIIFNKMQDSQKERPSTIEDASKKFGEVRRREELILALEDLRESYLKVEEKDVIRKIEKQIKL